MDMACADTYSVDSTTVVCPDKASLLTPFWYTHVSTGKENGIVKKQRNFIHR